jgi:putative hydrolase of the HAD superfamily
MIKAIIFDLGGVYLNTGIRLAFDKFMKLFSLSPDERGHTPVFFHYLYAGGFMSGRISETQYWKLCEMDLGIRTDSGRLRKILLGGYKEQKEVVAVVKKLKKKYRVGLLSDMPKEWVVWLDKKFCIFRNFDEIVVSGFVGVTKPNLGIYQLMLEKLGLPAEECLFIDDMVHNLKYPESIGMKTIHFEGIAHLQQELKLRGIEF